MSSHRLTNSITLREWTIALVALIMMAFVAGETYGAAPPAQKTFASPDDAVTALVQALKAHDRAAMLAILGNAGEWISSGDAVADRATSDRFVASYDAK